MIFCSSLVDLYFCREYRFSEHQHFYYLIETTGIIYDILAFLRLKYHLLRGNVNVNPVAS